MKTNTNGVPTAHICTNRNRLKTYGDSIYLQDKTNFEIELFNPLTKRVLVKIEIDGMTISPSGLILNPGQRAYLERWIDNDRKFQFSTYEVDNDQESKAAIADNGRVKVTFYEEQAKYFNTNYVVQPVVYEPVRPIVIPYTPYWTTTPFIYGSSGNIITNGNPNVGTVTTSFSVGNLTLTGCNSYTSNAINISGDDVNCNYTSNVCCDSVAAGSLETGRTEMGGKSDQKFLESNGNFNSWEISSYEWKLLPESQKPVEISKLREYCPGCRNRIRKQTWKFCPSCGEEL